MNEDWRYDDNRMKLRGEVLKILLSKYGGELVNGEPNIQDNPFMNVSTIGYHKDIKHHLGL